MHYHLKPSLSNCSSYSTSKIKIIKNMPMNSMPYFYLRKKLHRSNNQLSRLQAGRGIFSRARRSVCEEGAVIYYESEKRVQIRIGVEYRGKCDRRPINVVRSAPVVIIRAIFSSHWVIIWRGRRAEFGSAQLISAFSSAGSEGRTANSPPGVVLGSSLKFIQCDTTTVAKHDCCIRYLSHYRSLGCRLVKLFRCDLIRF